MIKNSISYPLFKRIIEYYTQSRTIKIINLFFDFLIRVFENSVVYHIMTTETYRVSKTKKILSRMKMNTPLGNWYQESILLRVILKTEEITKVVFKNNKLFQFFLDDEVAHGD